MVRNGKLWYEMVMVQNSYGTKWFLAMVRNCNFVVRNGKLWYENLIIISQFYIMFIRKRIHQKLHNYKTK
jgi:hypothetical protein